MGHVQSVAHSAGASAISLAVGESLSEGRRLPLLFSKLGIIGGRVKKKTSACYGLGVKRLGRDWWCTWIE